MGTMQGLSRPIRPPFLAAACMVLVCACASEDQNDSGVPAGQPTVGFAYHINGYVAPSQVTLTNQSQNATAYVWDFGDGTTSTLKDPVHVYNQAGTYTIKLIATNAQASNTTGVTLTIQPPYTSCRIERLVLDEVPLVKPSGLSWDPASPGDFRAEIRYRNDPQALAVTNTIQDVTAGMLPLYYDFSPTFPFPAFNQEYDILVFDDDSPDPDEAVGGYYFRLSDATTVSYHYPDTMLLYQQGSELRMRLLLDWGY